MKRWMIVTVETGIDWPGKETSVHYLGNELVLRPPTEDAAPDIRLRYDHPTGELRAFEIICRFLSALSWWHNRRARPVLRLTCTSPTLRGGMDKPMPALWENFALSDRMAASLDKKAQLALAIYREARSVENTPYEFLGYMKIVNLHCGGAGNQIPWMNATIPTLSNIEAKARYAEILTTTSNVGEYLYVSGRCAVAHASIDHTSVVDPDQPRDVFRLCSDMPIARALAEFIIERELGVPRERPSL